jgi:hypothetical protein
MPEPTRILATLAYTTPLRFVFRTSEDRWKATLGKINSRRYDYVKLHRLSASLDIGLPSPLCMYLAFDGSLLLPRIEQYWPVERAVSAFNEILGYMLVGGMYFGPVEPPDIDQAVVYRTGYFRPFGMAESLVGLARRELQYKIASPLNSIRLYRPDQVLASDIRKAYDEGKATCVKIPSLSPSLLVRGISAFVTHDWGASLSHLWITTEQIVEHLWRTCVVDSVVRPDPAIPGRRDFLKDHRAWTTATRIELLFQKRVLPIRTYRLLNIARKGRNDLVHTGVIPKREACEAAMDGVFQLIARVARPRSIHSFAGLLRRYKSLDPIKRHYNTRRTITAKDVGLWLGPLPPIPGEEEWGDDPFENVFESTTRGHIKGV